MKLINGDCLTVLPELIDEGIKVDMILTDIPYGTTDCKWDEVIPFDKMWECIDGIRKDTTPILLFGVEPFSSLLRTSNIDEYRYDWIWKKSRFTNFMNIRKQPGKITEFISVFYKKLGTYNPQMEKGKPYVRKSTGKPKFSDKGLVNNPPDDNGYVNKGWRFPKNILDIKFHNGNLLHPTQKPTELLEYLIKTHSNEGDLVLDFTMGSGSTGVACRHTNRDFIGIELDKNYYEIACDRINNFQEKLV